MASGKLVPLALVCLTLSYAAGAVPGATLSGISAGGSIFEVSLTTGQAVNAWDSGLGSTVGMALSAEGRLYVLTNGNAPTHPAWLYAIDAGRTDTPIGPAGLPSLAEGDIAHDPATGTLYGACDTLDNGRRLFTLDKQTGAATVLPSTPGGDISALAFDRQATLYALDTSLGRLLTVDKTTGSPLTSVTLSHGLGSTAGMSFDPVAGTLYVADGGAGSSTLYTLNPTTGALTTVGPTNVPGGVTGLAFVPEPGMLLLALMGLAMAARRRK